MALVLLFFRGGGGSTPPPPPVTVTRGAVFVPWSPGGGGYTVPRKIPGHIESVLTTHALVRTLWERGHLKRMKYDELRRQLRAQLRGRK